MKITLDNILILILLLFIVLYAFFYGDESNYCKNWENIAITATIFYALLIYFSGFFAKKFKGLTELEKGIIVFIVFVVIPLLSLPFIFGLLKNHCKFAEQIYFDYLNCGRCLRMGLLVLIAIFFWFIDHKMATKAENNKINYAINLKYSDIPVTVVFFVLFLYALYIGDDLIKTKNYDQFFGGAIAFQLMFSNIIWMYNDDNYWKSIINTKENENATLRI